MIKTTEVVPKKTEDWSNFNFISPYFKKIIKQNDFSRIMKILQNVTGSYVKIDDAYYFSNPILGSNKVIKNNALTLHSLLFNFFKSKTLIDQHIFINDRTETVYFLLENSMDKKHEAIFYQIHGDDKPYFTFHTRTLSILEDGHVGRIIENNIGCKYQLKGNGKTKAYSHFYNRFAKNTRIHRYWLYEIIENVLNENGLYFYTPTDLISSDYDLGAFNIKLKDQNKNTHKFNIDYNDIKSCVSLKFLPSQSLPKIFKTMCKWSTKQKRPTLVVGYDPFFYKKMNQKDPYLEWKKKVPYNQFVTLNKPLKIQMKEFKNDSNPTILIAIREAIINFEVFFKEFIEIPNLSDEIFHAWKEGAKSFWMLTNFGNDIYAFTIDSNFDNDRILIFKIDNFDNFYREKKEKFIVYFGDEQFIQNYMSYDDFYVLSKTGIPGFRIKENNFDTSRNMLNKTGWFFDKQFFLTANGDQRNDNMRYLLKVHKPMPKKQAIKILDNLTHPYLSLLHAKYDSSERYMAYLPASLLYLRRYLNMLPYIKEQ